MIKQSTLRVLAIIIAAMTIFSSCGGPNAIENIRLEYNVTKDDMKGVNVISNVYISGERFVEMEIVAQFFDSMGCPLQALDPSFSTGNQAAVIDIVTPEQKNSAYYDHRMFVPISALPSMRPNERIGCMMTVREKDNHDMVFSMSDIVYFSVPEPDQYATVNDIRLEHDVLKDGFNGMTVHTSLTVKGERGQKLTVTATFYDENDTPLPSRMNEYMSPSGAASSVMEIIPQDDREDFPDIALYIPYGCLADDHAGQEFKVSVSVSNKGKTLAYTSPQYIGAHNGTGTSDLQVDWLSATSSISSPDYSIILGLKTKSQINDISIAVNGQKYRGVKAVTNDGYDMRITQDVTLRPGSNDIHVELSGDMGKKVIDKIVYYTKDDAVLDVETSRRLALVIGNANYRSQKLANPSNDARDVSAKLSSLGFEVETLIDGTQQSMDEAIDRFGAKARNFDVALFYYAGHGIQHNGINYLIPVNAELSSENDMKYRCTSANRVLTKLEESQCQMNIIVLDACRNNPFERSWQRGETASGLTIMDAPKGTFIAYSTSPGKVAQDGNGRNSPYTAAFLSSLDEPGLGLADFFQEVSSKVIKSTNDSQVPWIASSFIGKFYFNKKTK